MWAAQSSLVITREGYNRRSASDPWPGAAHRDHPARKEIILVIVFSWDALPQFFCGLASGLLLWFGLEALGVSAPVAFAVGLAVAGSILVYADYMIFRRRNAPIHPFWRLVLPGAGGHIFFIPCWLQGAACIFIGCVGLSAELGGGLDSTQGKALFGLGFIGFALPIAYELYLPYEIGGRSPWEDERFQ